MLFFFRRRLRRYLLLMVALPVIGHLLVRGSTALEAKSGPTDATDRLRRSGEFVLRHTDRVRSAGRQYMA